MLVLAVILKDGCIALKSISSSCNKEPAHTIPRPRMCRDMSAWLQQNGLIILHRAHISRRVVLTVCEVVTKEVCQEKKKSTEVWVFDVGSDFCPRTSAIWDTSHMMHRRRLFQMLSISVRKCALPNWTMLGSPSQTQYCRHGASFQSGTWLYSHFY